jgi:hypothetical protein
MSSPAPKSENSSKDLVPGRAVSVPRNYHATVKLDVGETAVTVNSVTKIGLTLRLLKPGETAESLSSTYEIEAKAGLPDHALGPESELQRLRFYVPNWVEILLRQEGYVYRQYTEVPVWIDRTTGRIDSVDVDKLIAELEPERENACRIWSEREGVFADVPEVRKGH